MNFTVVRGNIVNVSADAIVLPANEKLKEGPETSKAIFDAAGRSKLSKACAEIGHCDTGSAVPTPAFDLDAKYIIHAAVPKWKGGDQDEYGLLSSAYLTSLKLADIMHCESIAFPLLASGNNGFDRALAFQIAQKSIHEFEGENLKKVTLVVYGENAECFMRSQGYDVTVIAETKHTPKIQISDEASKIIEDGLKAARNWLKDENNIKKLLETGLNIALIVLAKGGKGAKAIEIVKKLIK